MHRRDVLRFLSTTALAPLLVPLSARERWSLGRGLHQRLAEGAAAMILQREPELQRAETARKLDRLLEECECFRRVLVQD